MLKRSITCLVAVTIGALAAAANPTGSAAQSPSELVDRIVAVVGDTAILQSELQDFLFQMQARGVRLPEDPDERSAFIREALDQKVNEALLLLHAGREGITVLEADINAEVDRRIAQVRSRFSSEIEFQQALSQMGTTPTEYRLRLTDQVRAELIARQYLQQRVSQMQPIPVSEEEIRERFDRQKASLGTKPAQVTVKQVIITPEPSEDALLLAREVAAEALSRARAGEDFARLVREYSDDAGTRERGGELGWVRRGQLLPEFEDALYRLRVGAISDPVKTAVGFHIIKLERVRGNERFARHILIRPEITDEDLERSEALAWEVAEALRTGADPDSLIGLYADPSERPTLTNYPQEQLPPPYREAIEGAEPSDVLDPFQLDAPGVPGGGKWAVVRVDDVSAGGEWTFEDVREGIRQQIEQERLLEKAVSDLRESTYIDIRLEDTAVTG